MQRPEAESSEAILFVDRNRVSREMLYSEFEAILDGFVPLSDMSNEHVQGVYVRVNAQLCVTAAVFFRINFDDDGYADKRWNVPLQQLADNAAKGPDLGAGAIRLACRSQCSIAWHHQNLWDPDMTPGANNFVIIKKTIKANRLGLTYQEIEAPVQGPEAVNYTRVLKDADQARDIESKVSRRLKEKYKQEFRDHMARLLKEQRLRILTLNSKRKQQLQQLQLEHQQRVQDHRIELEAKGKEISQQVLRNKELKDTIDQQAVKIEGLREYFEHKVKALQADEGSQLQELQLMKNEFEAELSAKVQSAVMEVKEQLQMREVELMYRREQESSLEQEITRLRAENQNLLGNSSEQLLERLENAGMNFIAYHPGAGHLTIPLMDMSEYLDNPLAYAAAQCGVTLQHYKEWLQHYHTPICKALTEHGEPCGEVVERTSAPGQFHNGESDRCNDHKTTATQTFAAVRM
ncbi:hypothetical protein [Aurantivibrio infirmus]